MNEQDPNAPLSDPALTPERLEGLRQTDFKTRAVGMEAVMSALDHARRYMSPGEAFKTMFAVNQKKGFDCPGCAWPDPDDERSALGEYCENGIKAIAEEAQNKVIGAAFFQQHSIAEMGAWTDFEIGKQGRIGSPMFLRAGATHYEPIEWAEAFRLIAGELNALTTPDEAVFYTSGRTSNEAAFLYQLFVRMYGTNNLPDCSNMCHESSGKGLTETVGVGKGTVSLEDLYQAELIIVMGQNPGTNHPRMLSALERCKENGGRIIAVNPLPEPGLIHFDNPQRPLKLLRGGTPLSDLFLQTRINGDVALLKALMLLLLEKEQARPGSVFDRAFIEAHTTGFEAFLSALQQYSLADCIAQCGVSEALLRQAADMIAERQKIIVCWAMGLTQHANAVDNIKEIVNLLLLRGSIGKPGAGLCPVRGHSNVQGDRTMGIWEAPPAAFLDRLGAAFHFEPPRKHGYHVVSAIKAMHDGAAKVFFALGGNFLSAAPDTAYTAQALRNTRLTVHVSTKLNRSHLTHGRQALILPCLGRTDKDVQAGGEQFVSCENSMGVVQMSKGVLQPPSKDLLSEASIVCRLAAAVLGERYGVDWRALESNYDLIRKQIEAVIPGFERYNERVRHAAGFYLPNAAKERRFNTASGKAQFSALPLPAPLATEPGEYLLMTIRSHDQFNTTIYGLDDRYRGIHNERRVLMMNEQDITAAGLQIRDVVDLSSVFRGETRSARTFIVVAMPLPRGCVAAYFPEANELVHIDDTAHTSHTPASKSVVVRIAKAAG